MDRKRLEQELQEAERELVRDFMAIPLRSHQQGVISLVRALAEPDAGPLAVRASRRRRGA
jgi:hypothetical protein